MQMKIGIIGTGTMGSILVESFVDGKAISPSQLLLYNRTEEKARALQHRIPEVNVCPSNKELIQQSDLIFICVKPPDICPLLEKYQSQFRRDQCVVSITSPVSVSQLEAKIPCSCARVVPSITNRALAGVSLVTFGENCSTFWREALLELLSHISIPFLIDQHITRVSSDIVSCGPAFFSFLLQQFVEASVKETDIDRETAVQLAEHMVVGLGELIKKGYYSLPTLQEKVCVKGGVTGEGIKVLAKESEGMFERLLQVTHKKFEEDIELVQNQFGCL
jgi:competence protein ComER